MFTVYVYFKARAEDRDAMTQALRSLGCELSCRVDVKDGQITVMERYRLADAPSPQWLQQMHLRAQAALEGCAVGQRHTEVFVDW